MHVYSQSACIKCTAPLLFSSHFMRTPMASTARLILSHAVVLLLLLLCAAKPATSGGWVPANPNSYTVRDLVQRALEIYDVSPYNNHQSLLFFLKGLVAVRQQRAPEIWWRIAFEANYLYIFHGGRWEKVLVDATVVLANSRDMYPRIFWKPFIPLRGQV
ncbi:hypothetical protein AXF42_Ash012534 [Apostasia shenzhenica]|uniref:Uncharacterized protein n=1 Tax=Apostasia shenzhenica TaxID=1088818 RepID=A0A2I0AR16_9ASPA|nr:hypothetical protein AXF42_Ash012534 [Apostasia shenzhenica]